MSCMHSFLDKHSVDVFGLSETNVDWRQVGHADSMWGRVHRWAENRKISVAHNTHAPQRESTYQAGGTAMLLFGKLVFSKPKSSQDPCRLGRWSSILLNGKGTVKTRYVSVYCPCRNTKAGNSVYQQHLAYYKDQQMEVCPIEQFWVDLEKEIKVWKESGEQIVIGGDWNHHIRKVSEYLEPLGLTERITEKHGIDDAPATYIRGSTPIDGIFSTATIQPSMCGYLPFNKGIMSDHRILWMDVPLDAVIGFSMNDPVLPKARRLKTKDPRVKQKYLEFLERWAVQHKLYQKMSSIFARTTFPLTKAVIKELEEFESILSQGMIAAEKQCRKLRRGAHPWSPEFARARDLIKLWTMVKQRQLKYNISVRCILRVAKRVELKVDFSLDMSVIKLNIAEAWTEYKLVKQHSKELRTSFLYDLAKALAEEGNTSVASKVRQLTNEEEQRRISAAVKFTTKKLFGEGLTRVLVPMDADDDSKMQEITGKAELEATLLKDNPKKYHRCEPYCQLMQGKLKRDIGLCGEGSGVPDILNGCYECPEGTKEGTKLFLDAMQKHPKIEKLKTISARSSIEEFCHCWKKAKEKASCSGDLHTGHYKAGCSHDSLRYLHYSFAEVLFKSGYSLDRHRKGIDVMLLKTANDFRLFRLRTIFLFDAQLNMNMGRIGTAGLDALLDSGDMADEQYSRPNRSAIDHVVNRRLMFDYFYFCKSPFGMCSCDLAGNYDRIAHAAASLALQRIGVPLSRIYGMFDTLQRMVKRVRTAYGDSDGTYGGDSVPWPFTCKPMGANQGNRIGPPLWSIISSTVFSILRKAGFGVSFIDALTRELYLLVGIAYVDDSDLIMDGVDSFEISDKLSNALKLWEEVMNATGQAMAPEKSWWYLVDFVWENGVWSYTDGGARSDLTATDSDGKVHSLTRLVFSQAKKMLGVYLAPNGDKQEEIKYLSKKAATWADMIRAGHLGPTETWIALSAGIWKTMLYPLAATTLSEMEIRSIIKPIMDISLPRMLINRNVSLALRYGPPCLGGLGIPNPFYDQGIKKVEYIVEHLWKDTPTGKLIQRNISSLCLECGVYGNLFNTSPKPYSWILDKDSWIMFTWTFMSDRGITLDRLNCTFLQPKRRHDVALMDGFLHTEAASQSATLLKLNACRLFLQVVSLSDICLADGKSVDTNFLMSASTPPSPRCRSSFSWPRQPCPPVGYWKLWNHFILRAFCSTNHKLQRPLGEWNTDTTAQRPDWDWFGMPGVEGAGIVRLWNFDGDHWSSYSALRRGSSRHVRYAKDSVPSTKAAPCHPHGLCRVSVQEVNDIYRIVSCSKRVDYIHPVVTPTPVIFNPGLRVRQSMLLKHLSCLEEFHWFVTKLEIPEDITTLFMDFLNGSLHSASDGSYNPDPKFGTACWKIKSFDRRCVIVGFCKVPGALRLQNSYRSELSGLLGISIVIWGLFQISLDMGYPPHDIWNVIVACDGYSALDRALLSSPDRLSTKYKHYDLVAAIMGLWRDMQCTSFPVHVKGHQDDILPPKHLTRLEVMNVEVDKAAKAYMQQCVAMHVPLPRSQVFHFGVPIVHVHGQAVSSELYAELMQHCTKRTLRDYWVSNWKFGPRQASLLTWEGFERAMIMLSRSERVFITKWLSRQVNVGPISQRYDSDASGTCLRCRKHKETLTHCLRCKAIRHKVQDRLEHYFKLLIEWGTSEELVVGMRLCTRHWMLQSSQHPLQFLSTLSCPLVVDALVQQYDFGWFNFLQGLWIRPLIVAQKDHFEDNNSQKSITFWSGKAISGIWRFLCLLHEDRRTFLVQRRDDLDPSGPAAHLALEAALAELRQGRGSLRFHHQYFQVTPSSLKEKTISELRDWLRTVRIAREGSAIEKSLVDDFSHGRQYRPWLLRK